MWQMNDQCLQCPPLYQIRYWFEKKYLYYYMMTDAGLVSLSKVRKSSFSNSNIGLIIDITGPSFGFY